MIFISPPVSVKTPVLIALVTMVVGHSVAAASQSVGLASAVEGRAITNSVGMKLVRIEPGTFTMGQDGPGVHDYKMATHPAEYDRADWDEGPAHPVTITRAFYMGTTEVTLGQYRRFAPDFHRGKGADDEAACGVTWAQAAEYCRWLTKKEGRPYRLPTEAEWEYACRAGTTTVFHSGDKLPEGYQNWFGNLNWRELYFPGGKMPPEYAPKDGPAWSNEVAARLQGPDPSLRVAQKPANPWGLYDMHGNVGEWCSDWYGPYENGAQTDPLGRSRGDFRVFRGGSHSNLVRLLRSANRSAWLPESASEDLGFRVVLGELPKGSLHPPPAAPLNAQRVNQKVVSGKVSLSGVPFFEGPKAYVKMPTSAFGPMFSRHNHSPAITECPNGDLLACWYSCSSEVGSELCNLASRLRLGATEWEPASPFWDGPDVNDHGPKLWWDGDKTIYHLTWSHARENIIRTSTDNGATWSPARLIFPSGEFANGMIRTREGSLIISYDAGCIIVSRDGGKTWESSDITRAASDIRPGGKGFAIAGIHSPVVQLGDGRLMTIGRLQQPEEFERFAHKTPLSHSSDLGQTWSYATSEFPAISSTQRAVMIRLREGPILLCSYTDQWKKWKDRKGMPFKCTSGEFTGYGLFAALSYDDGRTWPCRRLVTPGGPTRKVNGTDALQFDLGDTMAEPTGYLAITQTRDGRIQLITSKNQYVFNLAWLKQLPPAPGK